MTPEEIEAAKKLYTLIDLLEANYIMISRSNNVWVIYNCEQRMTLGSGVSLKDCINNATKGLTV